MRVLKLKLHNWRPDMSTGKYISLEEVLRNPKLLGRFMKDRITGGHGEGDEDRFEGTLTSMIRNSPQDAKTSNGVDGADCSDTQTRPNTSRDT